MDKQAPTAASTALNVLILEDDYFIADDLARTLKSKAIAIVGPFAREAAAEAALALGGVDAAILDVNLNGVIVFSVARSLRQRGIPFLFLTGYDQDVIPPEFSDVALVQKPRGGEDILAVLERWRQEANIKKLA